MIFQILGINNTLANYLAYVSCKVGLDLAQPEKNGL